MSYLRPYPLHSRPILSLHNGPFRHSEGISLQFGTSHFPVEAHGVQEKSGYNWWSFWRERESPLKSSISSLKMSFSPVFSCFPYLDNCISSSFCLCWQPESAMWSSQLEVSGTFLNHLVTVKMGGLPSAPPEPLGAATPLLPKLSKKSNKPNRAPSQAGPPLSSSAIFQTAE